MSGTYWPGNAAKTRILDELLGASDGRSVTVLDHGCGRGGDWPRLLDDHPNVHLVAWDIDPVSARFTAQALAGKNAEVHDRFPTVEADFIVSFSVLEHVRDRQSYMRQAAEALKPDGVMYLNYDDGHFRTPIDVDDGWKEALRAIRLMGFNLAARAGVTRAFQRRVTVDEADALVDGAGLVIEHSWYHNVAPFKRLARHIVPTEREDYARFCVEVEERLNGFTFIDGPRRRGDSAALWQEAASRSLRLRHRR